MNENMQNKEQFFRTLDGINDDLHAIVRLVGKPEIVLAAPEVMDAVRLALQDINSRSHYLASRMRSAEPAP